MQIRDLTEMTNDRSGETTSTPIQRNGWRAGSRPIPVAAAAVLLVVALIAVAAIAGGDDSDTADTAGAVATPVELADDASDDGNKSTLTVIAENHFRFDAHSYETQAGEVTFEYVNEGDFFHSLRIQGVDDFRLLVAERGDVATGTVDLEAGSYTIVCDIEAHTAFGMHAKLEVT